ncbi:heavy metal-associated isoprenylated plant protein 3 [Capsicum annuum]
MIEIVLAVCSVVGGAFLNVLFEEAADLLKMFLKNKQLKKHCLQIVQSDAENKQASNQHVRKRLKVEGQLRNLAQTSDQQKNEGGEKKKKGGGEENKKDGGNLSVVLKPDCNCEGCATKVVKAIRSVGVVEKVMRDVDSKKLTVIGKVDLVMLREKVAQETRKNVEVVSPIPKKDGKGKGGGDNGGDNVTGEEKKKMQKQNKEKDSRENTGGEDKKTKEKEVL